MLLGKPEVIVALVADLHINDSVGLCPHDFPAADGGVYLPSPGQRQLWKAWLDIWRLVAERKAAPGAPVVAVWAGDIGDLNKHSNAQLITPNKKKVQEAMLSVAAPALAVADYNVVIRGTEAHVGPLAELEEQYAADIGAERPNTAQASWWVWQATLGGVRLEVAHHPPGGTRLPQARNQAAARAAATCAIRALKWHTKPALLYGWGHLHYSAYGNDMNAHGFQIPCLKLVGAYGYRSGNGSYCEPVGALLWELGGGDFRHEFLLYHPRPAQQWTLPVKEEQRCLTGTP